jgi:hypothetical protein
MIVHFNRKNSRYETDTAQYAITSIPFLHITKNDYILNLIHTKWDTSRKVL